MAHLGGPNARPRLAILGTRGVPAGHGGFETFAERLSIHLTVRGWDVTVYCQVDEGRQPSEDYWEGVKRVLVPAGRNDALGTMVFDAKATAHAARTDALHLVLGYNTALLNALTRLRGRRLVMNMDGLEWKRSKWNAAERAWLRLNEVVGARVSHALVADHPEIARHLTRLRRADAIETIPYGADAVREASLGALDRLGLSPGGYYLTVARIEPENSLLEVVRAHRASGTNKRLVMLGRLDPAVNRYHALLREAASDACLFPGPIYEKEDVAALRYHAFAYVHGHTVGGTNPSLVEAMGAGNAVLAHENPFNRWVAGEGAIYFSDESALVAAMRRLEEEPGLRERMAAANRDRHASAFTWDVVLGQYEAFLGRQWDLSREPRRQP
jgi:glycosyltransferase involved in cell wall biosynthesis